MRFCEEYILFLVSYGVRRKGTGMGAPGVGYGLQGEKPLLMRIRAVPPPHFMRVHFPVVSLLSSAEHGFDFAHKSS